MTFDGMIAEEPTGWFGTYETGAMLRLLEEASNGNSTAATVTLKATDSETLRNTFSSYGSALLLVFLLFCWARLRYPRVFNLRNWIHDRKTPLAENQHGFISWFWVLYQLSDNRFCDECGMDAVCLVRICSMGSKLCCVGMFVSIFLMPVYVTAEASKETAGISDPIVMLTTANLGAGSNRLIGTVIAAYCVFGAALYLIHQEFLWFVQIRHRYLMKPLARNYGIYLRNIPEKYQTNKGIKVFFDKSGLKVLESHICCKTTKLQATVSNRESTVLKLEHAVAEEDEYGVVPKHKIERSFVPGISVPGLLGNGKEVNSIEYFAAELDAQNEEISKRISEIRAICDQDIAANLLDSDNESTKNLSDDDEGFLGFVKSNTIDIVASTVEKTAAVTSGATDLVTKAAKDAAKLVMSEEDGEIFSAGFVVFEKLSTKNAAMQQVHHENPYSMEVLEAPDPDDVLWANCGRQHKDLQIGRLISATCTILACLLWTIPVSFVASLSSVEGLRQEVSIVDRVLVAVPSLEPIFEVVAPQLLVILNALLPILLEYITKFEGPISNAMVEASLFVKLAAFMIIQTFFVSALSGSVISEISRLLESTTAIVDLLADSLPTQSTFFMQMAFVMTTTSFAIEGLRIVPIAMAFLRKCIGPNLTSRERGMTFMGIRPLSDPIDFPHADFLSNMVLFFMVYLVYAVIAPLVSFVVGLCFAVMGALFRHQFVYIYAKKPDSGGFLWLNFFRVLTTCLLIAEVTVVGLLALKKAKIATPLMFPLIVVTALFSYYIRQEHYRVAQYLPSRLCLRKDARNEMNELDFSFVKDEYLQPELREKEDALDTTVHARIIELGLTATKSSEKDGDEENSGDAGKDDDNESAGSGPPSCVVASNPWLAPRESISPSGLSCRVTNLGSSSDPAVVEDVSMLSEDSGP